MFGLNLILASKLSCLWRKTFLGIDFFLSDTGKESTVAVYSRRRFSVDFHCNALAINSGFSMMMNVHVENLEPRAADFGFILYTKLQRTD